MSDFLLLAAELEMLAERTCSSSHVCTTVAPPTRRGMLGIKIEATEDLIYLQAMQNSEKHV